jgi:hypothetical protein
MKARGRNRMMVMNSVESKEFTDIPERNINAMK